MKNKHRRFTPSFFSVVILLIGLTASIARGAQAGRIVAWGGNEQGGEITGQLDVPSGDDFVAIDAGQGAHSLAVRANGSLAGWGWNYGAVEFGTRDTFLGQAVVPQGNDFKAVAAGVFHSLALKTDGSVVAWGIKVNDPIAGGYGQADVPAGLSNVVAIAAGDFHSLALKADGSLVCWGNDVQGEVTDIPAGNDFVAIAAGDFHNVALKADGSLVVWGDDETGQISKAPSGNGFVSFSAGWGQTLAIKTNGAMVGWGWNFNGQATPRTGTNFVATASGWRHSLALKTDGSVVAWGWNYGDDMSTYYGQAIAPPGNSNFVAISAGFNCNLGIQVQPVLLNLARSANNAQEIVLSWPTNNVGFTLETSSNIGSLAAWSKVSGTPTTANGQFNVSESLGGGNRFYRLRR